jgi:hypothetical protein
MSSAAIYLSGLDSEITLTSIASIENAPAPDDRTDPKGVAYLTVDVSSISRVFRFGTNAADLTDISNEDIHFFVDAQKFADMMCTNSTYDHLNNGNGNNGTHYGLLVDQICAAYVKETDHGARDYAKDPAGNNYEVDNKSLMKDLFRDLAHQLFSTQYGVDLFQNETELSNNVYTLTSDLLKSQGSIYECLSAANEANSTNVGGVAITDASNIGNVIFKAIMAADPSRFTDLSNSYTDEDSVNVTAPGNSPGAGENSSNPEMRVYRMPFVDGDSICFHINYKYDATQGSIIGDASKMFDDRLYKIVLDIQGGDVAPPS